LKERNSSILKEKIFLSLLEKHFVILRWKLFTKYQILETFPGPKNLILENIHPRKYDHNYINARILGLEKSNYRPVFLMKKFWQVFLLRCLGGGKPYFD